MSDGVRKGKMVSGMIHMVWEGIMNGSVHVRGLSDFFKKVSDDFRRVIDFCVCYI